MKGAKSMLFLSLFSYKSIFLMNHFLGFFAICLFFSSSFSFLLIFIIFQFDVTTTEGISAFNVFIQSKSYVQGFKYTPKDIELFDKFQSIPNPSTFPHASRWYSHISTLKAKNNDTKDPPTGAAAGTTTTSAKAAPATAPAAAAATAAESSGEGYDRWTVRDDSTINYGRLSKTNGAGIGDANKTFYITTAINYTNGPAHMGHAYEAATSDVIARFQRLKCSGNDQAVYFLTGADEHGQKIANTAADQGKEPIEICDKVKETYERMPKKK